MPVGSNRFPTTSWTLVLSATRPEARQSVLGLLCEAYWQPVFAYLQRHVGDPEEAKDLTQGFFARLLEKRDLQSVEQERGRFRWFLLSAVKHYAANERDRARAGKRGGGHAPLRLDFDGESGLLSVASETLTPDRIFEKRWALLILDRALRSVKKHYENAGQERLFQCLKPSLLDGRTEGGYQAAAVTLGISEGAVKMAAYRLRQRFATAVRSQIGVTVQDEAEVEDEIRYLLEVLRT